MTISKVYARQILDSRGIPTVEVDLTLENGICQRAAVPSGASTGSHEAVELRDADNDHYHGKSVFKAVSHVNQLIAPKIEGQNVFDQKTIDDILIELDGTENKRSLGANAILGVSVAVCKAGAKAKKMPLYRYIAELFENKTFVMPRAMILLMEGGKHGNWSTDIQEYMVLPFEGAFATFAQTLEAGVSVFYALEGILSDMGYATGVGFEGAFCPKELSSNEEAFEIILKAIKKAGYSSDQFGLAVDGAASEFFENGHYILRSEGNKIITPRQWSDRIISWVSSFPIVSLEDMHQEELWEEWAHLKKKLANKQIVGDDLVTTNVYRIQKAIDEKSINSVLIKPNQIGTVTETFEAIRLTKTTGFIPIISHRGGETNDDFVADLAVGTGASQVKFGGPDRGERLAKYNQLLRIEELLQY